jgi:hypothetical protein
MFWKFTPVTREVPVFLPAFLLGKLQIKSPKRAHLVPNWLPPFSTILMGTLLELSFVFFSFLLFVAPFPFSLSCQIFFFLVEAHGSDFCIFSPNCLEAYSCIVKKIF